MVDAIIVDVDGTLVDVTTVRHHVITRPKNFDAFHLGAEECPPVAHVLDLVQWMSRSARIVIVTTRMEQWRASTERWLSKNEVVYGDLHMRADGDYRPDFEIKREILADIRIRYQVRLAIDDNPAVVALWRSEGIPTIEVPGWEEER